MEKEAAIYILVKILTVVIITFFICFSYASSVQAETYADILNDNFEDGDSTGWTTSGGVWDVATDGTAKVFRQSAAGTSGFSCTGNKNWVNYYVQARFRIEGAASDKITGIRGRVAADNTYYWLRIKAGSPGAIELYKNINGTYTKLAEDTAVSINANTWYTLKLDMKGITITGYLDGVQKVQATNGEIPCGAIGTESYLAAYSFDDVIVYGDEDFKPLMTAGAPAAGMFVKQTAPEYASKPNVYHALYLPKDWTPGNKYPVIVEYPCNKYNGYTGKVEDSNMGYYMSGGSGYIWVVMPVINEANDANVDFGFGNQTYTTNYLKTNLRRVLETYGGDPGEIFITGFSRGAINCNYIGTYNDKVADIWLGFIPFAHMDGALTPDNPDINGMTRVGRTYGRKTFVAYGSNDVHGKLNSLAGEDKLVNTWHYPVLDNEVAGYPHTDLWCTYSNASLTAARSFLSDVRINHYGTWNITGKVTNSNGIGLANVLVESGPTHFTRTDSSGNFTLKNMINGTHTVKAALNGYLFSQMDAVINSSDSTCNFTGSWVLPFSDSFESGCSDNWTIVKGTWAVMADSGRPLEQQQVFCDTDAAENAEGLAYTGEGTWSDYAFEAKVKLGTAAHAASGLVFRYMDANNYYMLRLHKVNQSIQLYKKVNGTFTLLEESAVTVSPGTWYTLRAEVRGGYMDCYLDGVKKLVHSNSISELLTGKVGIRTFDDTASFDDAAVTFLAEP